jgi:hypothetical protein
MEDTFPRDIVPPERRPPVDPVQPGTLPIPTFDRRPTHPKHHHGGRAARWRRLLYLTATLVMLAALTVRLVQELTR